MPCRTTHTLSKRVSLLCALSQATDEHRAAAAALVRALGPAEGGSALTTAELQRSFKTAHGANFLPPLLFAKAPFSLTYETQAALIVSCRPCTFQTPR